MTAETVETNGNPLSEAEKTTTTTKNTSSRARKPKEETEVTALSVKGQSAPGSLHFHQSETLPNNRPIEDSHLNIVSTYSAVGSDRPVTASDMEISGTLSISGNRPIAASHLQISETYTVMGNRPVASNEIDDASTLMGFLD
jgi:hypothetical protein